MHLETTGYLKTVDDIVGLNWEGLTTNELQMVSEAYYYFSVQFCETVDIAVARYPTDEQLAELRKGECDTDNLSPYPGVANPGEQMNHDEFMRRTNNLSILDRGSRERAAKLGAAYLEAARAVDPEIRISSLPSYEDGGLEKVFRAVLRAKDWDGTSLQAFKHFLEGHVRLDSDPAHGHGSLCRHLVADERIAPLCVAFKDLLVGAAPSLAA